LHVETAGIVRLEAGFAGVRLTGVHTDPNRHPAFVEQALMTRHWLQTATDAIRRNDHRNIVAGAVAAAGAALAIGGMEWLSLTSHYPLVMVPFATSIVLVIGSPDAEPAQPRALIGGHVVATLAGLLVLQLTGPHAWAAAAAVGLAVLAMYLTGTFHPPAGINPLLVVSNNLPWTFLLAPVLAGALLLAAFALAWHRGIRRRPWPMRWL
jgi:CBS-domain-containing membrane protein